MKPGNDARTAAQHYLDAHLTYVAAMKALLDDLGKAREQGRRAEEDRLCDALIALQRLGARQSAAGQSAAGQNAAGQNAAVNKGGSSNEGPER